MRKITLGLFVVLFIVAMVLVAVANRAEGTEPCVPQDPWTETIEHPEVSHEETVVVVDQEAWIEVIPAVTERVNHVWTGGPVDGPPPVPSEYWQPNNGNHNGVPHQQPDGAPYQVGQGNGDWFVWLIITVTEEQTINHPAVTHEEVITVVDEEAWTEVIEHEGTDCPDDPTDPEEPVDPEDPTDPQDPENPGNPDEPKDPVVTTETHSTPTKTVKIFTHESGKVTRSVKHYPSDLKEEGM